MGTRIGFVASEKEAVEKECCDVGLDLKMQTTSNSKKMMMINTTHHHHHHHHFRDHHYGNHHDDDDDEQPTLLSGSGGFGGEEHGCEGSDACSGPFLCNNNNNQVVVASMSDIYDVVGATTDSASFLMPLPCSETLTSHNSSGVMVNANVRVPNFTAAQRQELERQTVIYKYMMASLPVPPQLLIPISKTSPNLPLLHHSNRSKGCLELGLLPNSSDTEPWRCRRTDGKKWRCSRNVVPDQKYCERHSHKSRPRSRKPVEQHQQLHSHFFTNTYTNNTSFPYPKSSNFRGQREKRQLPPYSSTSHDQTRGFEWFMKGEEAAISSQEWHQVVHVKSRTTTADFTKPQSEERAFDFYNNNNNQSQGGLNEQFGSSLIESKLVPSQQTRHFIDAWSMAERDHNYSVVSSNDKVLPYSSLTLSMQGGNGTTGEESTENSHMGFGIEGDFLFKSQWMSNNAVSWNVGSTSPQQQPGGPLAEALCLGMAGSTRTTTTTTTTTSSRSSS